MKKKFVIAVLSLVCALMCALGLAACSTRNDNPPVHTHDYAWTDNGDGTHNGHCSVSGCDKPNISNESHIWDTDNKCKKCKAVKPNDEHEHTYTDKWTSAGAEGHYHIATCEHKDEHTDIVPHVYDNETDTICNYCGYVREVVIPHTHNLIPTEANAATCTSDGNIAYWYCADCGNYYSDENGNTEITLADTVIDKLNHDIEHHDGQAATCTEDGWSAYDTCKRDGCNYTTYSVITKLGHDIEHVAKQNPTCVSVGWDAYDYCKRKDCGYTTKVEKPATGIHTGGTATCTAKAVCEVCHNEYGEIDANNHDIEHHNGQVATCTADGWNEYDACTRVGCKYTTKTTIPKLGHNFSNEFTTDKEPTCTEEGSKSKHCSRCEATTEETAIPANGHSWNNGEVTTEPNCTEAGVRTYTCSVCQDTRTEEIAALGHDYATEFTTDKEPTCTEAGSKSKHCSRCEATTEVTVIPANGHGWNNGEVTKESNCTETGVKTYTCSVCQATKTEEIAALGHDYATEFTTDKDPTCTENGSKSKHCSRCEATTEVTVIPANGHSWNNGEVTKEPNCTETGVKTYTCSICQDTRAEEIAAHGHTKGEAQQTVNPTCTEQGYTVYTCEVCNNEFNADYLPALGHSYNSEWICIRCGHEYATDGLVYELSQDGTHYTVVGYTGNSVQVVIPAHYNDIPVIAVGAKAFNGNTNISSVFLSKSIETVGGSAFRGCSGLTSITLPFVGANKDGTENTHFGYIFGASSAQGTFNSSSGVYLNGNQRSVPSSLKTVIITGGTSIEKSAFYACSGLTSIKIPESITSIEKTAFAACSGLTSITVDENNSNYASQGGILYNKAKTEFIHIPQAIKGAVMIPNGVTSIGVNAFAACSGLTSITIPNSVTSIGEGAFAYCSSLTSITIPYVGASKDGTSNTHFGYIFGASSYSDNSQYIPSSLKTVIITGGESIGFQAFYGCDSLESITLPFVGASKDGTSNTHFGYIFGASSYSSNAQYLPSSLKLVIITGGESIGHRAFYGCSGLASITIPDSVMSIGDNAFSGCSSLTSITIHNGVTSIGSGAFSGCSSLTSITIPNSVTSIWVGAFSGCSSLTSITIHNGVTSIGSNAFSGCSSLTSITIPNSVTSIGVGAFSNCSSLTSIMFKGTQAQWNAITKGSSWNYNTGDYTIHCADGDISKS